MGSDAYAQRRGKPKTFQIPSPDTDFGPSPGTFQHRGPEQFGKIKAEITELFEHAALSHASDKFYLEMTPNGIYWQLQSSRNDMNEYPFRTISDLRYFDIRNVVSNIFEIYYSPKAPAPPGYAPSPESDEQSAYRDLEEDDQAKFITEKVDHFLKSSAIIVDQSAFMDDGKPFVSLNEIENLYLVDEYKNPKKLKFDEANNRYVVNLFGCCTFGYPPQKSIRFSNFLKERFFDSNNFSLVNFMDGTKLDIEIKMSARVQRTLKKRPRSAEDLLKLIEANPNSTMAIMAHNNNGKIEIPGSGEYVSLQQLSDHANEHNILLLLLVCNSSSNVKNEFTTGTVLDDLEIIKRLDRALVKSISFSDFFMMLPPSKTEFYIDINQFEKKVFDQRNLQNQLVSSILILGYLANNDNTLLRFRCLQTEHLDYANQARLKKDARENIMSLYRDGDLVIEGTRNKEMLEFRLDMRPPCHSNESYISRMIKERLQ